MELNASKFTLIIIIALTCLLFFNLSSSSSSSKPPKESPTSSSSSPSAIIANNNLSHTTTVQEERSNSQQKEAAFISFIIPSLDSHPACAVVDILRKPGDDRKLESSSIVVPSSHVCFKHGGHVPGCSRLGMSTMPPKARDIFPSRSHPAGLEWKLDFHHPPDSTITASSSSSMIVLSEKTKDPQYSFLFSPMPKQWENKYPLPQSKITQIELAHALVLSEDEKRVGNLRIYSPGLKISVKIPLSGIYSMVSGNWPQTLTKSVTVFSFDEIPEHIVDEHKNVILKSCRAETNHHLRLKKKSLSKLCHRLLSSSSSENVDKTTTITNNNAFNFGYWQPSTDFLSSYHVTVEVTLTMFHSVFRSMLLGSSSESFWSEIVEKYTSSSTSHQQQLLFHQLPCDEKPSAVVITSRPMEAMWGFNKKSCHHGAEVCLKSVWASMYVTLFTFLTNSVKFISSPSSSSSNRDNKHSNCSTALSSSSVERGRFSIIGLSEKKKETASSSKSSFRYFQKLSLGYPTFCEPLWGPDPLLLHDYFSSIMKDRKSSSSSSPLQKAVLECDLLLWMARSIMIEASLKEKKQKVKISSSSSDRMKNHLLIAGRQPQEVRILYASRRNDWARDVINEEVLLEKLDKHLDSKYHRPSSSTSSSSSKSSSDVQLMNDKLGNTTSSSSSSSSSSGYKYISVARFNGKLEDQVLFVSQNKFTIYIGAHGANIIPSLFLPPNAGVITLDVFTDGTSGFYPYGVFPSWLHWKRVGLDRVCNKRLEANRKGKCKVRSPNNDDLRVSRGQIERIINAVDEIIEMQKDGSSQQVKVPYRGL